MKAKDTIIALHFVNETPTRNFHQHKSPPEELIYALSSWSCHQPIVSYLHYLLTCICIVLELFFYYFEEIMVYIFCILPCQKKVATKWTYIYTSNRVATWYWEYNKKFFKVCIAFCPIILLLRFQSFKKHIFSLACSVAVYFKIQP